MRAFFFSSLILACLLSSCRQEENQAFLGKSSTTKPVVAIVPVFDNSESGLGWDLSDELTYSLTSRLATRNKIAVVDPQRARIKTRKLKSIHNPFGNDLSWLKQAFASEDFIVFLELIEHREYLKDVPEASLPENRAAELELGMRVRILDLRGNQPKIVLQEIIQDSHFIPKQFTSYNFDQSPWNSEGFNISPVGIAHTLLIKELCSRIEDYIHLSNL